jgi:phosphoenolpyruvate carboxykinase (ATP)
MDMHREVDRLLAKHSNVADNISRKSMIAEVVDRREAVVSANGALACWTPPESTGRSPKDTYIVRDDESGPNIDWDSPNNIPMEPETFDMIFEDALRVLGKTEKLYITDRVVGADSAWAMPVKTVTDFTASALFTDNMFRPVPQDISRSVFADRGFLLLSLLYHRLDPAKYKDRLRVLTVNRQTFSIAVAMDFHRRVGIVYGSAYGGSVKKMIFTVMNYILPGEGLLPLHCSANEGPDGDSALLLGLSGTGKTTLSADPRRALLGDDEHGWSENGIANFEAGCYAKLINLNPEKEPEIYRACFHDADYLEHGAIIENCMMYPDGKFDVHDERLTPNSRGSYPLHFLSNIKDPPVSGHPKTMLFLTADANGVLPPVSKLSTEQAMLWFLMGYTSKLAGTETGIVDPVSTFSRFFGEPFMPRNPDVYATMLGEKLKQHGTQVYLVNTGWSGGPHGVGERIDINLTRAMVHAALSGQLEDVECVEDETFHLMVPTSCPGIEDSSILNPRNTWADKEAYDRRAEKLAGDFCAHFDKAYSGKGIDANIEKQCPGK